MVWICNACSVLMALSTSSSNTVLLRELGKLWGGNFTGGNDKCSWFSCSQPYFTLCPSLLSGLHVVASSSKLLLPHLSAVYATMLPYDGLIIKLWAKINPFPFGLVASFHCYLLITVTGQITNVTYWCLRSMLLKPEQLKFHKLESANIQLYRLGKHVVQHAIQSFSS